MESNRWNPRFPPHGKQFRNSPSTTKKNKLMVIVLLLLGSDTRLACTGKTHTPNVAETPFPNSYPLQERTHNPSSCTHRIFRSGSSLHNILGTEPSLFFSCLIFC
ncbi:hypothetical protein AYI68_g1062 [Smittium mucronatum]|uniref:Uncharacterized protein n=1 Tax=Smittium mucronatum TaxID=133383 RepID=A0A1R0H6Q7_9FUNG|nr:hypothetical protein AYI68_g1062 [Smittium mucronatum]